MLQMSPALPVARLTAGPSLLAGLGARLDELNDRCGVQVTQRRLWQQTWYDIHPGADVWGVWVTTGNSLDAALVLNETAGPDGGRDIRALCPRGDDRLVPAVTTGAAGRELAGALAGSLRTRRTPWSLSLGPAPQGDVFLARLQPLLPGSQIMAGAPIPLVDPAVTRDACAHGANQLCLSTNMQRNLRKAQNRLAADGCVSRTETLRDAPGIESWLERLWRLRCDRDAVVGRGHHDPGGTLERFWDLSLRAHARLGQVELSMLHVDGRLAAYVLALTEPAAYRVLEGRFDSTLARYNPGRLLEADVVRRVVCRGGRHLDWMNGVAPEKLVAATTLEATQWLHAAG